MVPGRPRSKKTGEIKRHWETGRPTLQKNPDTKVDEQVIAMFFRRAYPRFKPTANIVRMDITAYYKPPKRMLAKKYLPLVLSEKYPRGRKEDYDNISKLVNDSLEGLAFVNDGQCHGETLKFYSLKERTEIRITIYDELINF